ncbi:MAG: hypothetical protein AB9882_02355 [Ignavibacteriaceae bacterium]
MELIPILATIILVSTMSTFILAIGAYILYKVRERRGRRVEIPQPDKIQAELLTPEAQERRLTQEAGMPAGQIVFEQQPMTQEYPEPIFVQHRSTMPQPVQTRFTPSQQYVAQKQEQQQVQQQQHQRTGSKTSEQKFMKITSEGYVPVKDNKKDAGALKWR